MPDKLAYTISEACQAIGCRRTKLYELIGRSDLDARRLGSRTVILAESLRRYIAALPPAKIYVKSPGPKPDLAKKGDPCPQ
jgi:excisionase family DNA binding protein